MTQFPHHSRTRPWADPPAGTVGFSEEIATHHVGPVDIYLSEVRPMKHPLSGRDEKTMMKLVVARESQQVALATQK
jgi:glutathione reductase (NADPH)